VLNARLNEVMTYPLVGAALLAQAKWPQTNEALRLQNPWSPECDRPRPSMLPTLLAVVQLNQKNYERFGFFEMGRRYLPDPEHFVREEAQLGIACFDRKESRLVETLEVIERLLAYLGVRQAVLRKKPAGDNETLPAGWAGAMAGDSHDIVGGGDGMGSVVRISPVLLQDFKIRGKLAVALLDVHRLAAVPSGDCRTFTPIPRFPFATFDCTVTAGATVPVEDVLAAVRNMPHAELRGAKVLDVFKRPDGARAVTVRATFGSPDRTLTGVEISELEKAVLETLNASGFPLSGALAVPA